MDRRARQLTAHRRLRRPLVGGSAPHNEGLIKLKLLGQIDRRLDHYLVCGLEPD